jgi:ureidoacrylate peracid hydrolase
LSREVPIDPAHAALLFVDVQNYNARPDGGEYAGMGAAELDARYGYFFRVMRETALPNMQRLQSACRHVGIEVMYTVIEALTRDGARSQSGLQDQRTVRASRLTGCDGAGGDRSG